ncbi:MAG: hypothetical protein IKE58_00685 [Blautia sp.]|nr:hypothetical protein [Blautia sp.]
MFDWLNSIFNRTNPGQQSATDTPSLLTRPCKSCGRPIYYDPRRGRIPSYCQECKAKRRLERQGMVTITCRKCGRTVTLPEDVQHWPDLCQECRAKDLLQTGRK